MNRCLEAYLRCVVCDKPKEWESWLHWAEYCYNTSYHTTLKTSPFRVVYGREPPLLVRYGVGKAVVDSVEKLLVNRDA